MILKVTRLPKNKDRQVAITVNEMAKLVKASWWNREVRLCADRATVAAFSPAERVRAMSAFVAKRMVFLLDPRETELIRVPIAMAREINYVGRSWGDCDDYALILASMVSSYGFRSGFVTMATSPHNPAFRHVFVCVELGDGKIEYLDPSVLRPYETGNLRTALWWIRGELPPRV